MKLDTAKRNRGIVASILSLFFFAGVYLLQQREKDITPFQQDEGLIFGTIYHISYQHDSNLKEEIEATLHQFDASLSPFNKESIISRVNRNEAVECDAWFTTVFDRSKEIWAATNGAFDPTLSPLINGWGFGFSKRDSITPAHVDSLLLLVGMEKVNLRGGMITKEQPQMSLNFSAVAKGYACDVVGNMLRSHGISNFLVEIGGEITSAGNNPKGDAWRIGINKPIEGLEANATEVEEILYLHDGGMATSGNYRNFYTVDGKRIAHTIDPHSGYPVQHSLLSATVVAADCMSADAYATAFMVLGVERSLEIAEQTPNLEAYLIYAADSTSYGIAMSKGMRQFLGQ